MTNRQFNHYAVESKTFIKSSSSRITVHLFETTERRDEWVARKAKPTRDPSTGMTTQRRAVDEDEAQEAIERMNTRSSFEGGVVKHEFPADMEKVAPPARRIRKKPANSPLEMKVIHYDSVFDRWPFLASNFDLPENANVDPTTLNSSSRFEAAWRCDECGATFRRTVRTQAVRARKGYDTEGHVSCGTCVRAASKAARLAAKEARR